MDDSLSPRITLICKISEVVKKTIYLSLRITKNMRLAAIDLGSNTFHLIIADSNSHDLKVIYKTNRPIKLSEDITKSNEIIPVAFERGINCLKEYKDILNDYNVVKVKAVATSAIRSAQNGQDFIVTARDLTGIDIQIISGEEEASLIYESVKASGAIQGKSLIMDIGGGSTEFIFCDENKSYWKKSFDIGAARLMQKFWMNDPISNNEIKEINNYLEDTLLELITFNQSFGATCLIGSAGAFETFIEMINPATNLDNLKSAPLDINQYRTLSDTLVQSTHNQRAQMPNLIPLRVDMIVMASVLTDFIIQNLNIQELRMTTYDLKYGVLNSLIS